MIRRKFAFFHEQSFVYPAECGRKHRSDGNTKSLYYCRIKSRGIGAIGTNEHRVTALFRSFDFSLALPLLVPFETFQSSKLGLSWNFGTGKMGQLVREAS
jgi:hypothetical protein